MKANKVRQFSDSSDVDELIHRPFYPVDIRPGDAVFASVSLAGSSGESAQESRVWKISPLGIELIAGNFAHSVGTSIDLKITIANQLCEFSGVVVSRREREGESLLGIRWCEMDEQAVTAVNRRSTKRWLCGSSYMPTGVTSNPARFNDFIYFRVRDVSSQGLQLITSLRNKFLIPGMRFESFVTFPMIGQLKVDFQVTNVRLASVDGKDCLSLGAKVLNDDSRLKEVLGQYVLQFGPSATIDELRAEGLKINSTEGAIDFGFVRTAEEYREVLSLRQLAYSREGKIPTDSSPEDTADSFDSRSRILIARHHGKIVGSLRLIYHDVEDMMEHEQFASMPPHFPRKDEMVEITRVCTHPEYRKSDLLIGLFKHTGLAVIQSGRRWILGSSTDKLLPIYEKIGFRRTEVKYRHEDLGNDEHTIFLGDVHWGMTATNGVGPILWNVMYADLFRFVSQQDLLPLGPGVRARLAIYRLFAPIAKFLVARSMKKPRKKVRK